MGVSLDGIVAGGPKGQRDPGAAGEDKGVTVWKVESLRQVGTHIMGCLPNGELRWSGRLMLVADLFVISGNQAAGKTTVAHLLAQRFSRGVHVEADDLQRMIVSGCRWPEMRDGIDVATGRVMGESGAQLTARLRNACLVSQSFVGEGFTTVLTDIIVGWRFEELVGNLAGVAFHFVMLRPSVEVLHRRERERASGSNDWEEYIEGGIEEMPHIGLWLDTKDWTASETVDEILRRQSEALVGAVSCNDVERRRSA